MKIDVYEDAAGEYRWRLVADNGKIVGDSGEGYKNRQDVIDILEQIMRKFPEVFAALNDHVNAPSDKDA